MLKIHVFVSIELSHYPTEHGIQFTYLIKAISHHFTNGQGPKMESPGSSKQGKASMQKFGPIRGLGCRLLTGEVVEKISIIPYMGNIRYKPTGINTWGGAGTRNMTSSWQQNTTRMKGQPKMKTSWQMLRMSNPTVQRHHGVFHIVCQHFTPKCS